jgi:quercetin dioxygenase-like cupin family protein
MDYRIDFTGMKWKHPASGVRSKEVMAGDHKLRLVEFSEEFVEADWCRKGHAAYVIDGEMIIDFNGKKIHYRAGDGVFIPPGEEHRHIAFIEKGKKVTLFSVENIL